MNWEWFWMQILYALPDALPWVLGGLAGLAMISFGPLGRALTQRLRRGEEEAERLEGVLQELTLLRGELGEVLERLDYAQRRPALHDASAARDAVPPPLDDSEQAATTPV
ncbi:MAG: hypothetical protein JSW71_07060 [Gemmatimonadota bacterium]|nr:MAG: hypothetical protein JSW71_07060 [Gemmatimonadota bacterium]